MAKTHQQTILAALVVSSLTACTGKVAPEEGTDGGQGPGAVNALAQGRALFRDATFGTEGYWTDAVGLGRGIATAGVTLADALDLGLQIDGARLTTILAGEDPLAAQDDPAFFQELLAGGAVLGLVAADRNGDGVVDLDGADTLGVSCALCHAVVDGAEFLDPVTGGAIGAPLDGPAPVKLDLGSLLALATNSRALYPYLPQSHQTVGGFPISRDGGFVEATSTEAEVDALLRDRGSFPRGTWDTIPDGLGAPVALPALYDIRRATPLGVAAEFTLPANFINAHVTYGLDPTTLLTPDGAFFLDRVGLGIGTEIRGEFEDVLTAVGATPPFGGYPYVDAATEGVPGSAGAPVGLRLAEDDLDLLSGYLSLLRAPAPEPGNFARRQRGETLYGESCASCHGDPAGTDLLPPRLLTELLVPYFPTRLLDRGFPYSDVLNDALVSYDDRFVLFDRLHELSQVPEATRLVATPQLTGLHLRDALLHDASIATLDELLDPARGAGAPHPVYIQNVADRAALVEYLTTR